MNKAKPIMQSILACFVLYLSHFVSFLPTIVLFVSFNKAIKLYVIYVHLLNLTFETMLNKMDLDHKSMGGRGHTRVKVLTNEIQKLMDKEEIMWHQRAKNDWLKFGD